MAYTWKRNGGVRLSGKLTLGGSNSFKLMSAGDLDWDGVEVESGVNLNTTDDLLNYIKGGNRAIIGRIDELELSNAGYEIRCDKSVCYVGDTIGQGYQNQKLPISIYKNGTLLSWADAYTDGITFDSDNFTKPSGGNDLIHWSTSDCYLSGTANKVGTYVFNFKRNGVSIASYTLTVLLSSYKSTLVVVYTSSNTGSTDAPQRPTGGRYDFDALDNNLQDIEPWQTSVEGLSGVIWFCTGYVSQETPDNIAWGEPNLYLSKLGTPGTNWKITTLSEGNILVPVMYARSGLVTPSSNDDCLTISPNYIRSYKLGNQSSLTNDSWRILRNGEAYFAKGQAVFNSTGAFHIGGQNGQTHTVEANGTTSLITDGYIDYNPISGTLQIGGLNISITGVDYALIGANVTNSLSGDQQFIGLVASQAGLSVIGNLNTGDVSVGNGACFFKGADNDEPEVNHGVPYAAHQLGAGHLAKGNIWWDADGNLSIGGQLRLKGTSLEWGGAVQYYEFIHHGTFGGYDHGSTGEYAYSEPHYKLPDPKEYLGREVFVEVFIDEAEMQTLANAYDPTHDSYIGRYVPSFEIESDDENHKWIRWGGDACTYVSCDISRDPKFYKLGNPNGVYTGSGNLVHSIGDNDRTALNPAFMMDSTELGIALTGVGGNDQVECKGLYLIPTPVKWFQIEGSSDPLYEGGNMRLRMRCQAKRLDFAYNGTGEDTDRYYWEIQSTDFMPCFMVGSYNPSIASLTSSSYTNQTLHNETKSSFRATCEDVVAATGLAFDL